MFRGSINKATIHPREVVKEALQLNAAAVILAHNHPSGDSTPSDHDIELTHTLKDILKVIDVRVLDHLVIGEEVTAFSNLGFCKKRTKSKKILKPGGRPAPDRGAVSCPHFIQNNQGGKTMTAPAPLTNDQITTFAPAAGSFEPIDGVSARYSFVQTLTAVDLLRDAGWFPIHAEQSAVRNVNREGYQRHLIRFAKNGLSFDGERVDLVLFNSHDRGCAFKLIASVWRQICGNGLIVRSEIANFSHKHIGFSPDNFIHSAGEIASAAGEIADRIGEMKAIEMTPDERGVFAQAAHSLIYDEPENAPILPGQLLEERRYDDKGKDLWTSFNVVNENIIRGGLKGTTTGSNGRTRRTTTRPVKSLDRNIKLNQALWFLTEKMAELKQAA